MNKAIVFKSDYTPARFLLAQIAVQEGKTNEAILYLEEARFLAPDDLGVLFQLGLLYYQKGDFSQEKGYLERAHGRARGIKISEPLPDLIKIPLLGYIAAGQPIEAIREKESIAVPQNKIPRSGTPEELLAYEEIDAKAIVKKVKEILALH